MYRRHGQKLELVFLVGDLAVTAAVWIAAYWLRFALWTNSHGVPDFQHVAAGLPTVLLCAAVVYRAVGLYDIHRLRGLPRELGVVGQASGLLFLLAITAAFYRRDLYESRLALALFLGLNAVGLTAVRRGVWFVLKHLRRQGLNHGRAIIVGAGRTGRTVSRAIQDNSWTGLEAVGFVDQPVPIPRSCLPNLGGIDDLRAIVVRHDIDHVFLALPLSRYGELPNVYRALEGLLLEVQLVPAIPPLAGMKVRTLEIDDVAFLSLRGNPLQGWRRTAKRGMDIALGLFALALFAPLMVVLAALVKWTSPGPVLYRQTRTGLGGREFAMYKFRTMRANAEARTGPIWTRPRDERCTPLGRFLRRWSLDELPQLFNVLAGHMSLVGPRPERRVFVDRFEREVPSYPQRHHVKAGMTGWAQVNGWRGATSWRRRLECDLYYVNNWSLWLDLKILWLTVWRGFRHHNAY